MSASNSLNENKNKIQKGPGLSKSGAPNKNKINVMVGHSSCSAGNQPKTEIQNEIITRSHTQKYLQKLRQENKNIKSVKSLIIQNLDYTNEDTIQQI